MDEAPSLSSYLVFNTVAKAGNLSQAAKILTISQPAVSKSLSRLEDLLKVKLFIRNSRGVRLTSEGEVLFQHTSSAFDSLTRAELSLKQLSKGKAGALKLGTANDLCHHLFAPQLKIFTDEYPNIKFDITLGDSAEIFNMVENSLLDAGFIIKPSSLHRLEYIEFTTLTETYACSPSFLESPGFENAAPLKLNNAETELDFALAGTGIIHTYREFIEKPLSEGFLKEIDINKVSTLSCGLIFNRTSLQQWEVQKLLKAFKK